jgi:hypothetical protein
MDAQQESTRTGVAPLAFAIGIVVSLVGLVINPLVIAPLGAAIAVVAAVGWIRRSGRSAEPIDEAPAPKSTAPSEELYCASRRRAGHARSGQFGQLGVALPAVGAALLLPRAAAAPGRPRADGCVPGG